MTIRPKLVAVARSSGSSNEAVGSVIHRSKPATRDLTGLAWNCCPGSVIDVNVTPEVWSKKPLVAYTDTVGGATTTPTAQANPGTLCGGGSPPSL